MNNEELVETQKYITKLVKDAENTTRQYLVDNRLNVLAII